MKLDWLTFWISALACYRITIIITRDKIGKPLRELHGFFKCTFCVSVWIASLVVSALFLSGIYLGILMSILLSFAFSAITVALDRTFSADYIT